MVSSIQFPQGLYTAYPTKNTKKYPNALKPSNSRDAFLKKSQNTASIQRAGRVNIGTVASLSAAPKNWELHRFMVPISFAWPIRQKKKACPPPLSLDPLIPPDFRPMEKTNAKKLEMAQELSDWMIKTMRDNHASVAVVARGGTWETKTQDKTLMEHAGLLIYDKNLKHWVIYDLLNNDCAYPQRTELWRNKPVDFFYAQPNYDRDALVLIPDRTIRKRLRNGLLNGGYKKLYISQEYNLVTPYNTKRSLNCNKWVLMNLFAAKLGSYNPTEVLEAIGQQFKPARIVIDPFLRIIAKQHPTILKQEVPLINPIKTVTVESLYRSSLFEKKFFFSGKTV